MSLNLTPRKQYNQSLERLTLNLCFSFWSSPFVFPPTVLSLELLTLNLCFIVCSSLFFFLLFFGHCLVLSPLYSLWLQELPAFHRAHVLFFLFVFSLTSESLRLSALLYLPKALINPSFTLG